MAEVTAVWEAAEGAAAEVAAAGAAGERTNHSWVTAKPNKWYFAMKRQPQRFFKCAVKFLNHWKLLCKLDLRIHPSISFLYTVKAMTEWKSKIFIFAIVREQYNNCNLC